MAEFNKGYYRRQGRVQGANEERERIVKMLEAEIPVCEPENPIADSCHRGDCDCAIEQGNIEDLIALIKGETE